MRNEELTSISTVLAQAYEWVSAALVWTVRSPVVRRARRIG